MKEAILLAGGLGTRLKEALPDTAKCMAPIHDKPFINYIIDYLTGQGIQRMVFALGYKAASVQEHLQSHILTQSFAYSQEIEPLGTGGAIKKALGYCTEKHVLIVNADTLYKADLYKTAQLHQSTQALCTLTLKPMQDSSRYGTVVINETNELIGFVEKQQKGAGLINGGLYLLQRKAFLEMNWPDQFSFEKNFLEAFVNKRTFAARVDNGYFIDIGIKADYEKAILEIGQL